jgi:hypothetical protein
MPNVPSFVQGAVVVYDEASGTFTPSSGVVLDVVNQSAALVNVPIATPKVTGIYLVTVDLKVVVAAAGPGKKSTGGPITLTYFCGDTNVLTTTTMGLFDSDGVSTTMNNKNLFNFSVNGSMVICVKNDQPITVSVGYSSTGSTHMQYNFHLKSVFLGSV